jgi:hypothetical protein
VVYVVEKVYGVLNVGLDILGCLLVFVLLSGYLKKLSMQVRLKIGNKNKN